MIKNKNKRERMNNINKNNNLINYEENLSLYEQFLFVRYKKKTDSSLRIIIFKDVHFYEKWVIIKIGIKL